MIAHPPLLDPAQHIAPGRRLVQWTVLAGLMAAGCLTAQTPVKNSAAPSPAPLAQSKAATPAKPPANTTNDVNPAIDSRPHLTGSEITTSVPLKITMTPSEIPLKIGSTSNMAATIQNISDSPVSVYTTTLMLTTSAIVGGQVSKCVTSIPVANINTSTSPVVTLQAQDSLTVLFNLSEQPRYEIPVRVPNESEQTFQMAMASYRSFMHSCNMGWTGPMQRVLDFSPGDYGYYLDGEFSLCAGMKPDPLNPACSQPPRYFSASASFPVGIDQTSIVTFAVLGGWLALLYVIFTEASEPGSILHDFNASLTSIAPEEKGGNPLTRFFQRLTTSLGARAVGRFLIRLIASAILSAAFTVVSSRISNPSLPIRISVLDAWGAMTIGFLSYFIGAKFIASITNWSASPPVVTAPLVAPGTASLPEAPDKPKP